MIARSMTLVGLAAVKFYRLAISPYHPPVCRYTPSCSEYAITALRRYGLFKGGYLTLRRILRCHPFSSGGYDPVR
jgi:putative membrane protein insertion efficiency factor